MSFETLREKRFFFSFPLIALVRLHGWITKDSNRNAVQRGGTSSGEGEAPRWVMCLCVFPSFSLFHSLPTAMGFHNSAIKVDGLGRIITKSEASAVNVSSV